MKKQPRFSVLASRRHSTRSWPITDRCKAAAQSGLKKLSLIPLARLSGISPGGVDRTKFIDELHWTIEDHMEAKAKASEEIPKLELQPQPDDPAPINKQLDDLRCECGLTVEGLAELLDLTPRSVFRHLSGEAAPRKIHLAAYEKKFSEKLKRQVRFSAKRQSTS